VKFLNLGIVAHVDAGKTSLTERLLYDSGVLARMGRVDDGDTQTDSLALERERGITIRSAVVSFDVADVTVNLLDTPGHPDFIAEVERVLGVLDAAVLVISAVEGVQPQTRVLMRTLQRLRIPTVIFVNKIDRAGARALNVADEIVEHLELSVVVMGSVTDQGTRAATFHPYEETDPHFAARLADVLTTGDDDLLSAYVEAGSVPPARLRSALSDATRRAAVHPLFFGSAITGAGVPPLRAGLTALLASERAADGTPLSAAVFKVDRGPAGEKIAYIRIFDGTMGVRDRLQLDGHPQKVTAINVFQRGAEVRTTAVGPGRIATVWGLDLARVGDVIGPGRADGSGGNGRVARQFSPPTLETVVRPVDPAQRGALFAALSDLAEQDPFIALRRDDDRHELRVSLYGEVQKEVIARMLADDFGIEVTFAPTSPLCAEYVLGTGAAYEIIGTDSNPFLATVGLRVEPGPPGSGVGFRLDVELGSMPYAFMRAVEDTVRSAMSQGRHGWPVLDATVSLTHSGYYPRQSHMHGTFDKSMSSTAGDFRALTPLVLMTALDRAGTQVCEPVHQFELRLPAETYPSALPVLTRLHAVPSRTDARGRHYWVRGTIPAGRVHDLQLLLPGLTSGEGVFSSTFDHYEPSSGRPRQRPYVGPDPRDRRTYLRALRQVATARP
jgi:ribosomal protection tetracycline resistance protein